MNILSLTKYSYEGPSSRYRFYNYVECFKMHGIDMEMMPLFTSGYLNSSSKMSKIAHSLKAYFQRMVYLTRLLFLPKKYDLILIEYELFPYFPSVFEYLLNKRGIKYIVDYDDAIFHKYDMSSNVWVKGLLKNKIAKVMQYAEHVVVCNEYLESYAKKYNKHTFRLPTVVLLDKYKKEMENFKEEEKKILL